MNDELTDDALMAAYRDGDVRAFDRLLQRYQRPLYSFLWRQVGQRMVAEDLLQETFIRVVQARQRYEGQTTFKTWIYTVARNLCIDHFRRSAVRRAGYSESLDASSRSQRSAAAFIGEDPVERQDVQRQLTAAMRALDPTQRDVLLLREVAELSFAEIGAVLNCSDSTAKSRLRYALEHLRKGLNKNVKTPQ